jgi:hypothetical protein
MINLLLTSSIKYSYSIDQFQAERDGQYLVIKDEMAKEAETNMKKWLQKIQLVKKLP